ncbi:hypothetical protein FAIPA1_120131 [Frankia sp. AiPs1]
MSVDVTIAVEAAAVVAAPVAIAGVAVAIPVGRGWTTEEIIERKHPPCGGGQARAPARALVLLVLVARRKGGDASIRG